MLIASIGHRIRPDSRERGFSPLYREFHGASAMKAQLSGTSVVLGLVISLSLVAYAQDKPRPEAYSAVAIGTGGSVGGKTMSFNFRVTQYTTE